MDMVKKKILFGIISAVLFLIVMTLTEKILQPNFFLKSLIKISVTAFIFFSYSSIFKQNLKESIFFRKMKPAKNLYFFMAVVFSGILLIFFMIRNYLDLPSIRQNLVSKEQLSKQNCLFIFSYIAIVNSFLEESLFRGLFSHLFEKHQNYGILFSALMFSIYHLGIIDSWLNPAILIFCMIGLFLAGIFLQWICNHYDSVKASWLVHGCANLAIDTIGVILIFFY